MTSSLPLDEYSDALHNAFGDTRRGQRIGELLRAMREQITVCIKQLSFSRAQQKAFYRVLDQAQVIARLGGWGGFASETKPGVITLTKELEKFARLYQGYQLAKIGMLL